MRKLALLIGVILVSLTGTHNGASAVSLNIENDIATATVNILDEGALPQGCFIIGQENDPCGLRIAITLANSVRTTAATNIRIMIPSGHYRIANGDVIVFNRGEGTHISLIGENRDTTIIDAQNLSRIFSLNEGTHMTIENVTLQQSGEPPEQKSDGGCIINRGNLTLRNVIVKDCYGRTGGAINNSAATTQLTVINSSFNNNHASWGGGAISNVGILEITGSTFLENSATINGGAIYNGYAWQNEDNPGSAQITNCTFSQNSCVASEQHCSGGAIHNTLASLFMTHATLIANEARGESEEILGLGGAIRSIGPVGAEQPLTTLMNVLMTDNSANVGPDCQGLFGALGKNIVGNAEQCELARESGEDMTGIDASTLLIQALGDYGGATQTYSMCPSSIAVDSVPSDSCDPASIDQRGITRPLDGNSDGEAQCDIGAYELEPNNVPENCGEESPPECVGDQCPDPACNPDVEECGDADGGTPVVVEDGPPEVDIENVSGIDFGGKGCTLIR
jgi:hypothetical protein